MCSVMNARLWIISQLTYFDFYINFTEERMSSLWMLCGGFLNELRVRMSHFESHVVIGRNPLTTLQSSCWVLKTEGISQQCKKYGCLYGVWRVQLCTCNQWIYDAILRNIFHWNNWKLAETSTELPFPITTWRLCSKNCNPFMLICLLNRSFV